MKIEVGQIFRNKSCGFVFQITNITSKYVEYVYLPSKVDLEGGNITVKDEHFDVDDELVNRCELLKNYSYDGRPCIDCQAFCQQRCGNGRKLFKNWVFNIKIPR